MYPGSTTAVSAWSREVFGKGRDSLVMAVPAMCFFVQNLLFYVALSRLSAV